MPENNIKMRAISIDQGNPFRNKVAFISGSTHGLGYEIALQLSKLKAQVYVNGRKNNDAEKTVERIKNITSNKNVFAASGDISKEDHVNLIFKKITDKHQRLEFLINNAGQYTSKEFLKSSYKEINQLIKTNLLGHIHITLLAAKLMRKNNFGRIINISSGSGLHGGLLPAFSYALSKNGLIFMTKILSKELEKFNIKINTVVIRFMDTEMLQVFKRYYKKATKQEIKIKPLSPSYVAQNIIDLLKPKNDHLNGQVISIGGEQYDTEEY